MIVYAKKKVAIQNGDGRVWVRAHPQHVSARGKSSHHRDDSELPEVILVESGLSVVDSGSRLTGSIKDERVVAAKLARRRRQKVSMAIKAATSVPPRVPLTIVIDD
jgi:hypothetical protein